MTGAADIPEQAGLVERRRRPTDARPAAPAAQAALRGDAERGLPVVGTRLTPVDASLFQT
jgi:hypothetical protein